MDVDDHRTLAAELCGSRLVEKSRKGTPIKGLPVDHLCRNKVCRIESAGFACGPAINFAGLCVEGVAIERRLRRAEAESNVASVLVPLHSPDYTQRNLRPWSLPL